MADELAKAITKIILPALRPEGFVRGSAKNLIRVESGICQLLYFQLSKWGDKKFCVTASANLVAGNEFVALEPGYRLNHGTDMWLPSLTPEQAQQSATEYLALIRSSALPFFEQVRTPKLFAAYLGKERLASDCHRDMQRGIAHTLAGDDKAAIADLRAAAVQFDGLTDNMKPYAVQARQLVAAIKAGTGRELLDAWYEANKRVHGIKD